MNIMLYVAFLALQAVAGATFSCPDHINVDHVVAGSAKDWMAVGAKGRNSPLVNVTLFDGDPAAGRSIAPAVMETKSGFYVDYVIGRSASGTGIRCEYFGTAATFVRVVHDPLTCKFVRTLRPIQGASFECR